jgi:hypothetical protein
MLLILWGRTHRIFSNSQAYGQCTLTCGYHFGPDTSQTANTSTTTSAASGFHVKSRREPVQPPIFAAELRAALIADGVAGAGDIRVFELDETHNVDRRHTGCQARIALRSFESRLRSDARCTACEFMRARHRAGFGQKQPFKALAASSFRRPLLSGSGHVQGSLGGSLMAIAFTRLAASDMQRGFSCITVPGQERA